MIERPKLDLRCKNQSVEDVQRDLEVWANNRKYRSSTSYGEVHKRLNESLTNYSRIHAQYKITYASLLPTKLTQWVYEDGEVKVIYNTFSS
jgi:hypothetical protein